MDLDTALEKKSEYFTPEESKKISEEIDHLIQEKKSTQALDFSVHSAKSGYTFPVTIISTLVLLLSASIFGVWLYSMRTEQEFLSIRTDIDGTRSNLASVIIDNIREEASKTEQRISDISQQLDKAISEQQALESRFDKRVSEYRLDLEKQIAAEKEALRKRLEQEQLSSEEIERRLAQQNIRLNEEFNLQLQKFRQEQETEKTSLEKDYTQQVENLRQQQARQEDALSSLRSEIQSRESELEAQIASGDQELISAQRQIQLIARDKEKSDQALREFELFFKNVSLTIANKDYQSALRGIDRGRRAIISSPFSSSTIASVYLNAFRIQENTLEELIVIQSQLEGTPIQVIAAPVASKTTPVEVGLVSETNQAEFLQLQAELERLRKELEQQQAEFEQLSQKNQAELEQQQAELEQLSRKNQAEIEQQQAEFERRQKELEQQLSQKSQGEISQQQTELEQQRKELLQQRREFEQLSQKNQAEFERRQKELEQQLSQKSQGEISQQQAEFEQRQAEFEQRQQELEQLSQKNQAEFDQRQAEFVQRQNELEQQQEKFEQEIAILTVSFDTSQTDLLKAQSDLESEREQLLKSNDALQALQALLDSAEQRRLAAERLRDRTLERIDRISKTYAIQEEKQLIDQTVLLSNVQNIIQYLEAKSSGTEDSTLSNAILDLIQQEPVYRQIGTLLAEETDSTVSFP